jgi:hypothetical protein
VGLLAPAGVARGQTGGFHTRSARGTHPLPEGYGPRGPVGPSDKEMAPEAPVVTVRGEGRNARYLAYPPDDSEVFRKALAEAAEKGGGVVYVPPGVYRIDQRVTVPAKVTLHGAGRATHLYTTKLDGTGMFSTDGDGIRFTQFRIQGPTTVRAVQNGSRGISVRHKDCRIDHLELSGFGQAAIAAGRNAEATVEYVYDHHNTQNGFGYGVSVTGGAKVLVTDSEFEQNRHAIASNSRGTQYQCMYCYLHGFDETYPQAALDTHPGMAGKIEVAHNFFEDLREGLSLSDGEGTIHDNMARNVRQFCTFREGVHNGRVVPGAEVHDFVAERNRLEDVATPYNVRAGRNLMVDGKKLR